MAGNRAARRRPFHVTVLADGDIPSVQLIAGRPLEYLANCGLVRYSLRYANQSLPTAAGIETDLLLVVRAYDPASLALSRDLADAGIPVLYATDDDLELLDPEHPIAIYLAGIGGIAVIRRFVESAASVWVFSPPLQAKFAGVARDLQLMPAIAGPAVLGPAPRADEHVGETRLGFAGSFAHTDNLALVQPAFECLLARYPSLVVETIGQEMAFLAGHPRYRPFAWVHGIDPFFDRLRSRNWDIAVAPLRETALTAAKTDNKYRTYAASGVPAVYSDVPTFRRSVQHGVTGWLAENQPDAWVDAIATLLDDADRRQRIADAALRDAEVRFSVEHVAEVTYAQLVRHLPPKLGE